jgi:RNA polymerase subunit RPABC4/transcription elongation factor Spt4
MNESMLKAPAVVPFVECPNCKQLLEYGAEVCPRCREEINSGYAFVSAVVVQHNTQACSLANSIKGFDSFVWIAVLGSLLIYAIDMYTFKSLVLFNFILIWPAIPLLAILPWFYRFGRFKIGDEDYVRARRDMRTSLMLWLAILGVQLIILARWWWRTPAT